MKTIRILLALLAVTVGAHAQLVVAPNTEFALRTNSSVFFIPGITKTNLPSTIVRELSVGRDGIGFAITWGATNAASTTNATITFEATADGSAWIDAPTSAFPVISSPQNGTGEYTFYTNILSTSANIGNLRKVRLKSIDNTNQFGIFITNFTAHAR